MMEERMRQLEIRVDRMDALMRGKDGEMDGGLVHNVITIGDALFGRGDNKEAGIAFKVDELMRWRWMQLGALAVGQIVLAIVLHFWK